MTADKRLQREYIKRKQAAATLRNIRKRRKAGAEKDGDKESEQEMLRILSKYESNYNMRRRSY